MILQRVSRGGCRSGTAEHIDTESKENDADANKLRLVRHRHLPGGLGDPLETRELFVDIRADHSVRCGSVVGKPDDRAANSSVLPAGDATSFEAVFGDK
jgi:hypothetical protein